VRNIFDGVSRRDFLKYCAGTAAVLGLSQTEIFNKLSAAFAASAAGKPPVIWLEGQDCAGCTTSFASQLHPPTATLLLDKLSLRYHETIMAAAGHQAEAVLHETVEAGGYVLIVEGSIPTADGRFCTVGGRPFGEILAETAKNAAAILAVGACASFGGIPAAGPTGAVGVSAVIKDKPIINIPTCPVHPDHLTGTVVYYLTTGKVPPLDANLCPTMYFGSLIHDDCRRRAYFEEGLLLEDWNDPEQKNWCLLDKGCKGQETYSDCAVRRWNDGLNFCIDCGAGCRGCASPDFYHEMSPLYAEAMGVMERFGGELKFGQRSTPGSKKGKEA